MPPKSKAQARFMRAVAAGDVKAKGLSKKEAREYVEGHETADLPERTKSSQQVKSSERTESKHKKRKEK